MVKYHPMVDKSVHQITFLRHGESVGNAEDRFQGHADFPLTKKGRAQARALADHWRVEGVTFDQCIASPLLRAFQTVEIVSGMLKIPLELDADLMEIDNGLVAGFTPEQAAQVAPRPDFITPYTHYGGKKRVKAAGKSSCGRDGPSNISLTAARDVTWWPLMAGY